MLLVKGCLTRGIDLGTAIGVRIDERISRVLLQQAKNRREAKNYYGVLHKAVTANTTQPSLHVCMIVPLEQGFVVGVEISLQLSFPPFSSLRVHGPVDHADQLIRQILGRHGVHHFVDKSMSHEMSV